MVDINDLKGQILLEGLDEESLRKLAGMIDSKTYSRGETIFREGDSTEGIYMVKKGSVEINKETPDGWKQKLARLTENHFFGELSVIENKESHGANAEALEDTELLVIHKDKFSEMEQSDPALMARLMKTIARVASRNVHIMNDRLVKLLISY